ncbi:uncharacterized protein LOC108670346 [Hyalella azteca]|uniref:Uncharacterized protein LOC108670346 n=1 Tax=Hyalella azteca TaxID=294128 RepID=A0A979FTR8_HYAAZ|nr:uncharacterized protein LOC108670346 [Hyalella azteca]
MQGVWGSFRLVSVLATRLSLLAPPPSAGRPASLLHCAGLCLQDERCGGVAWLDTDPQPCRFVVDSTVPGATATLVPSAYAILSLDSSATVVEFPSPVYSWQETRDFCSSLGLKQISYPVTDKEKAAMSIRRRSRIFIDLQRQGNGWYTSVSSSQVLLPPDYPFPWDSTNPSYGTQTCLVIYGYPFQVYDFECNLVDSVPYAVICLV